VKAPKGQKEVTMRRWSFGSAVVVGIICFMFVAGAALAQTSEGQITLPERFSWYGKSGAERPPVYDSQKEGYWWIPQAPPAGQETTQWGNRGYIFVGKSRPEPVKEPAAPAPAEKVVYRDRVVEKPVEKIVYQDRSVEKPVERIVYRDRVVEKPVEKVVEKVVEKTKTVMVSDVYFDYDSAVLTATAQRILASDVKVLNANPDAKVALIGSASPEGTTEYNQKLSQRRLEAVRTWLVKAGIPESRFVSADAIGEVDVPEPEYPSARKVRVVMSDVNLP